MIAELCWLGLALIVGLPLALRLSPSPRESVPRVGEGLLLGIGICAATLALLPWSLWIVVAAVLAIAAAAFRPRAFKVDASLLIVALLLGYALYATLAPPPEFDYLADWGFKARAFFAIRNIDWQLLGRAISRDTHPDYPLLLPLTYDFIAVLRNGWNDAYLGVVHVVFAAALLLVVHSSAIEETRSKIAAAFITVALLPLAATLWIGMAEGPFIAYATAALLLIRRGDLTLGAILLGLAASTKNEGLTLIAAVAIGLLCARRGRDVIRLWPAVVIPMPWLIARSLHELPTDIIAGSLFDRIAAHLSNPRPLVHAIASISLGKPLYWIALAAGIVIAARALVKRERFAITTLLIQFAFYVFAYIATPYDVAWHVTHSWERLIAHLTPALTYVVLVSLIARSESTPTAQTYPTRS